MDGDWRCWCSRVVHAVHARACAAAGRISATWEQTSRRTRERQPSALTSSGSPNSALLPCLQEVPQQQQGVPPQQESPVATLFDEVQNQGMGEGSEGADSQSVCSVVLTPDCRTVYSGCNDHLVCHKPGSDSAQERPLERRLKSTLWCCRPTAARFALGLQPARLQPPGPQLMKPEVPHA